ncbi:MAG: DEAD/DEAH box helicase [Lentisphaerales bacterium]|nr:DEAD/DEAH box helicase [Lentisphaerales bacterium]
MSFSSLEFPDYLLNAVADLKYEQPTAVQLQAIPEILAGKDVVAEAQTGTGKTAAFGLPITKLLNDLPDKKKKISILSLVVVPTRELAIQVATAYKAFAKHSPKKIKMISLIGGESIEDQIRGLRMGVDIVVATPGRLLEIIRRGEIRLVELNTLVLDEADKMLDLGFNDELLALLEKLPKGRQNLLFSATFPEKVLDLSEKFLTDPVRILIEKESLTVDSVEQRVIEVDTDKRRPLLQYFLKSEEWDQVMVFVASKKAARNLAQKLTRDGFESKALHGDLDQSERFEALKSFKSKKVKVLVATDIAARGIDVEKLSCVVNFDLPRSPLDYVHRIGRTGRAGEKGIALSFIDGEAAAHFKLIEKKSGIRLEREQIEGFEYTGEIPKRMKGAAPIKGKRKSKKDKLREQKALEDNQNQQDSE